MARTQASNGRVVKTLQDALRRKGWTQRQLADRLGEKPQTVNKWLHGETVPKMPKWGAIERALDLPGGTLHRLITGTQPVGGLDRAAEYAALRQDMARVADMLATIARKLDELDQPDRTPDGDPVGL